MTKFIKVAYWICKEDVEYSYKMKISYINIDSIYKIYTAKKENKYYSKYDDPIIFNFSHFFEDSENAKKMTTSTPTIIITKEKDTFYHPLSIKELIKNQEISITNRFDIMDL